MFAHKTVVSSTLLVGACWVAAACFPSVLPSKELFLQPYTERAQPCVREMGSRSYLFCATR